MSSGQKRVAFNARERLISPDANRLQAFAGATIADATRRRVTQSMVWEESLQGRLPADVTAPLRGSVLQGLFVVSPLAATELAVEPGLALFVDPDGQPGSTVPNPPNPDDSPGKLCFDQRGVLVGDGVLPFTANPGPGVRVDVVEIQRDPNVVLETNNRDVFNPGTGLFTPVTEDKVIVDGVRYRIRLGTPGAGLPANALGWMPIAVVCVPTAATNFDACTIYDVRPLESDRTSPGSLVGRLAPEIVRNFYVDRVTVPGQYILTARMEGPGANGYWDGGTYVADLKNAALREPGFVAVANGLVYVWALYPGGLPRWVRYTNVAVPPFGGRVPGAAGRGIPCLSTKGPAPVAYAGLVPSSTVGLPPSSGFDAGGAALGQLVAALANDSGGGVATIANCKRGRMTFPQSSPPQPILSVAFAPGPTQDTVGLDYGSDIPYGARAVLLQATATFTAAAGTEFQYYEQITLEHPTVAGPLFANEASAKTVVMPTGGSMTVSFIQWVDLIVDYSGVTGPLLKQVVTVDWAQTGVAKGGESVVVVGWEL